MKINHDTQAVSPVIGVILMVAITVVLAAVVFYFVSSLAGKNQAAGPVSIGFTQSGAAAYQVTSAPKNLNWSSLTVTGCTTVPTGIVTAGQLISGCTGRVTVTDNDANSLVWTNGA